LARYFSIEVDTVEFQESMVLNINRLSGLRSMLLASLRHRPPIQQSGPPVPMFLVGKVRLDRCASFGEFKSYLEVTRPIQEARAKCEQALTGPEPSFEIPGICPVCGVHRQFRVSFEHCFTAPDGRRVPNWREHLVCSGCQLNSRMRAAVAFLAATAGRGTMYLTERTTPLYRAVRARFPKVIGSELLRDGTQRGAKNVAGIRHEDLTRLTLSSQSLTCVASFEVLEHIPDYQLALREIRRCLRPGGSLVMTVPFVLGSESTIVRASLRSDNVVEHHLPPEYHGDPLDAAGTLCFYNFGWQLLDELKCSGFRNPALYFYWSRKHALLAGLQFIVHAHG
jgi:SAM-dependent methyltransferase